MAFVFLVFGDFPGVPLNGKQCFCGHRSYFHKPGLAARL